MPMSSEANDSTPRRRSSVLRLLATGALTLLAGGIIAGCAATAPAAPAATAAPTDRGLRPSRRQQPLSRPRPLPHLRACLPDRLPAAPAARRRSSPPL